MAGVIEWALGSRWAVLSLCASALFACGNASSSGNGAESGGAHSAAGASGMPSSAGASGSAGPGAGASNGGASGAAANAGSGGAAEALPTSNAAACVYYARHYCAKIIECQGRGSSCETAGDRCPDLLFSDGSTRTIAGLVACAKVWDDFSCKSMAAGEQPDCVVPGTRQVGEPCLFASQCSTLSCSASQQSQQCGKCQATAPAGAQCDLSIGCTGLNGCESGSCTPTISAQALLGESCADNSCAAGTYCSTSAGKKCAVTPVAGQPCPEAQCEVGAYCDATAVCRKYPGLNQPCSATPYCATDSVCDQSAPSGPTCVALPGDGMPCGANDACASNELCEPVAGGGDGLCHALLDKGGSCTGYLECKTGLTCNQLDATKPGNCAAYALPGEPCVANTVCRPGGVCDGTQCKPVDSQGLFKSTCEPGTP